MKIAEVSCVFPPYKGGIGNVALRYSELLSAAGNEVEVFTPDYNKKGSEVRNGVKINRIKPVVSFGNAAFLPQLFFLLKDFDIIHLHYPFFGASEVVVLLKFFRRKKVKLIVHYHMDTKGLSVFKKLFSIPSELLRPLLFNVADLVTCASIDYVSQGILKNIYTKYKDKFREIPFGVDVDFFSVDMFKKKEGELLFVGGLDRAHYFKGIPELLEAIAGLDVGYELNIVGDGDMRKEYEETAVSLGIEKRVNFLGGLGDEDLIKYYQRASLFVLPSINSHEAFGLVLLEAMSCATPVVASGLPGVRKVFNDGEQGYYVEPGNVSDLSVAIKKIFSDKAKWGKMSLASRKLVEEKYSWVSIGKKISDVFNELKK